MYCQPVPPQMLLDHVSGKITRGLYAVMGPSGSGKVRLWCESIFLLLNDKFEAHTLSMQCSMHQMLHKYVSFPSSHVLSTLLGTNPAGAQSSPFSDFVMHVPTLCWCNADHAAEHAGVPPGPQHQGVGGAAPQRPRLHRQRAQEVRRLRDAGVTWFGWRVSKRRAGWVMGTMGSACFS